MELTSIKKWLDSNRNYEAGIALLSKHSKNRVLAQNLMRKQRPKKLAYELGKIFDRANPTVEKVEKLENKEEETIDPGTSIVVEFQAERTPQRIKVLKNNRVISYDQLPAHLKAAYDSNTKMYQQARSLHEKLKLLEDATSEDRKPLVQTLIKLAASIRKNWDLIDNYQYKEANVIDSKRISSNRAFISRALKGLTVDDKGSEKWINVQMRISELLDSGQTFKDDQKLKLTNLGFLFNTQEK